jgi:hypothetical protein
MIREKPWAETIHRCGTRATDHRHLTICLIYSRLLAKMMITMSAVMTAATVPSSHDGHRENEQAENAMVNSTFSAGLPVSGSP